MENQDHGEVQQLHKLVRKLAMEIDVKNTMLSELEEKYTNVSSSLRRMAKEKARNQDHAGETPKRQHMGLLDERPNFALENQKKELELRAKELEEREVQMFAEKEKIDALQREMDEKVDEFQCMEALNNALIQREYNSNNELQDARKFLIKVLPNLLNDKTTIGIKRMGEINDQPFQEACAEKYPNGDWQLESIQLCSSWQERICDPNWHPFRNKDVDGKLQEFIDEDDCKLKELRATWGETVYKVVVDALLQLNDYNSSGRFIVPELWNYKEGRKASLKEVLPNLLNDKTTIGIKRMGEINDQPFQEACAEKYPNGDWQLESIQLCSSWQERICDPNWHPFRNKDVDGKLQEFIDEDDCKLKELRATWGETVYKVVVDALLQLNDYNSSGRFIVPELWNYKEGRKASLKEVIEYLIQRLKPHSNKRKR